MKKIARHTFLMLGCGLFLLLLSFSADTFFKPYITKLSSWQKSRQTQETVLRKEEKADALLTEMQHAFAENEVFDETAIFEESRGQGIYLYIYKDNILTFWTSNAVFPAQLHATNAAYIQELGNGIYLQKNNIYKDYQFVALIPVKQHYSIENQYLKNNFVLLGDKENIIIHFDKTKNSRAVYNKKGEFLFGISCTQKDAFTWVAVFFCIGLALCLLALHSFLLFAFRHKKLLITADCFSLILLLIIVPWKLLKVPQAVFSTKLFSPEYYGSSELLSSLGDLLMLTALVCYLVWFILKISYIYHSGKKLSYIAAGFTAFFIFLFAGYTEHLTRSLVLDSQISFDLSNIFGLSAYSIVGLVCIFGWLAAFFALVKRFAIWLVKEIPQTKSILRLLLICLFATVLLLRFLHLPFIAAASLAFGSILVLYLHYRTEAHKRYWRGFIYLVLSTIFLGTCLIFYNQKKQIDAQRLLATRLATERDAIAEYLFNSLYQKIRQDPYIKSYYLNPVISSNFLQKRVKQLYFSGYFSKYDVLVSSYTPDGIPFKIDYEKPLAYYMSILERGATPVQNKTLYFLHTFRGLPGYMAKVPITKDGFVLGTLLIQFQQKAFYEESLYPELLLTSSIQHFNEQNNYSYAIFNKNTLFTQKGNYPYPSVSVFPPSPDSLGFARFNRNGYTHLVHFINQDLRVVVSQPQQNLLFYLSIFTFVLLFFGICWLLFFILPKIYLFFRRKALWKVPVHLQIKKMWAALSFRYKILSTITGGISLALFLIGFATITYIIYQYEKDELAKLQRRTKIITARLENELQSNEQTATMGQDELDAMVKNLSDMYRSDINLFDAYGNLLSSTQSGIYEQEIIAPKMNAKAFLEFHQDFASQVVQEESIGKLDYTAAYMPLRNIFGDIIGYMNIPYFSKEKELTDRISSFLMALINLYLLIFLLLVLISVIMARALTTPLDLIRNHLKNTSLGGNPVFLQWHTDDEIGKLVSEYNAMIVALQNSANKLAQSEREGAWREMAKQVAHEIKNPLTPMKLKIQQLQKAFYEDREDIKPLFDKVTELLINQIDSLSEIATSFSSFAQMPQGVPQTVDANTLVREVVQLFSHDKNANFCLSLCENPALVSIDPKQLSRVLTNLVKNAIQAFQDGKKVEILLQTEKTDSQIFIRVKDNGTGIPQELQSKIFVPSFSTKTSGMGLGLAISKKIINHAGGEIYFDTTLGEGTTFTIELPIVDL